MTHSKRVSRRGLLKKGVAAAAAGAAFGSRSGSRVCPGARRGHESDLSCLDLPRNRPRAHDAAGRAAAADHGAAGRRAHRGQQPVLLERRRRARHSAGLRLRLPPLRPPSGSPAPTPHMALIQGHGGVGVVEAVGPEVRRVQVGDRVCVSGTPQCGSCYHCLRGRADVCQLLGRTCRRSGSVADSGRHACYATRTSAAWPSR